MYIYFHNSLQFSSIDPIWSAARYNMTNVPTPPGNTVAQDLFQ